MNRDNIIQELEAEHDRLNAAIAALQGSGNGRRTGRPKRHMSEAAKHRQSLAAKRRWKAAKKAGKNRL
jgi:hypothetical protein